ncbi:MAG: tRNA-dihydrouridine synthase A [Oleispira sp.]|jgi:tRNA-dihydrouridine synthase A
MTQANAHTKTDKPPANSREASNSVNRRFTTAPMMEWSDSHCRQFWRHLTSDAVLYTEMVTTGAIIYGNNRERFLGYGQEEHPIALQLGGSNAKELAECARYAQEWGYDEVNLNVGCPSDRVQNNMIGACLMGHPQIVADGIKAMQDAVDIDVTVKHRIGIDNQDSYPELVNFVSTVAKTGCKTFIVHARKAILQGLSPKENRDVPPLKYDWVYQLKQDFPDLEILINGGLNNLDQMQQQLNHLDGVMVGREAYHNPYMMAEVDNLFYGRDKAIPSRHQIVENFMPYIEEQLSKDIYLSHITRHILGIFHGQPGARQFRRYISENAHKRGSGIEVLRTALSKVPTEVENEANRLESLARRAAFDQEQA